MTAKAKAIQDAVRVSQLSDSRNYRVYLIVREIVVAQVGKKLTKRVAGAVMKAMPDYTVHYDRERHSGRTWGTKIIIWGNGIDYGDAIRLCLGAQDKVDLAVFEDKNAFYGTAAAERIDERQAWLNDNSGVLHPSERIADAHDRLLDAQADFEDCVNLNGCDAAWYEIEKALDSA